MAKNNEELSSALAKQGAEQKPLSLKKDAQDWFGKNQLALSQLMGSISEARRLYVTFMSCVSKDPLLLQCDPTTIWVAMMQCAELRLYPGPLKQCALIAYRNDKKGVYELQMQPQYQGILDLAYRAGFVKPPTRAIIVWERDEFEYSEGIETHLRHVPNHDESERGERKGVYVVLTTRDGIKDPHFFAASRILRYRNMSKAFRYGKSNTFWKDENPDTVDWMWKKTALKQALKLYPMSAELARAVELDDEVEVTGRTVPLIDLPVQETIDDREPNAPAAASEVKSGAAATKS